MNFSHTIPMHITHTVDIDSIIGTLDLDSTAGMDGIDRIMAIIILMDFIDIHSTILITDTMGIMVTAGPISGTTI